MGKVYDQMEKLVSIISEVKEKDIISALAPNPWVLQESIIIQADIADDITYYILIGQKGSSAMVNDMDGVMTITPSEFAKYTNSIWDILPAKDPVHPAIFPIEIPRRLIKLFTWTNCVVLDPFAGSGTTLVAARDLGRKGIGYELSAEYVSYIRSKISQPIQLNLDEFWSSYFSEELNMVDRRIS